jgi:hypothetical protein
MRVVDAEEGVIECEHIDDQCFIKDVPEESLICCNEDFTENTYVAFFIQSDQFVDYGVTTGYIFAPLFDLSTIIGAG